MSSIRRISEADAFDAGYPGYQVVVAASPESTTVLAGFLAPGGHPPLHIHDADLFYIPVGMPHRVWDPSSTPVRYLEADIQAPDFYAKLAPAR